MTFDWWTLGLQAINFLVLVWVLQRLLYRPVLAVIARRKALVDEAFADAEARKQAAEVERGRLEQDRTELADSRQDMLRRAHEEIEADRARMLEDTRAQANKLMDETRERLAAERATLLADIRAEIADLAVGMAATVLQEFRATGSGDADWSAVFRTQMLKRIARLSDQERADLQADLRSEGAELCIVTAEPLPAGDEQAWKTALRDCFPDVRGFAFLDDAALIGGVELRFPHAVLSLAWSEVLRRGRTALLAHDDTH